MSIPRERSGLPFYAKAVKHLKKAGLLGFFLRTRILNEQIPLIASFKLTYRCNLSCSVCPFHRRAHEAGSHMDWDTALRSLDKLKDMGCRIVVFEGGEPLLWKDKGYDFIDLAHEAGERFLCTGATTNGTVRLDVPTDVLWVSIDGTRDTHNSLRSGSYEMLMDNIKSSQHRRLFIHYTLNSLNWRDFPAAVMDIVSINHVQGITVQFYYPYNQGEENLSLSYDERKEAVEIVMKLKRQGYPVMNSSWALKSMVGNDWQCREWLLANVEPDGRVHTGCYVKNRGEIRCSECGFTPVAEASGAFDLRPGSLLAGWRLFLS